MHAALATQAEAERFYRVVIMGATAGEAEYLRECGLLTEVGFVTSVLEESVAQSKP